MELDTEQDNSAKEEKDRIKVGFTFVQSAVDVGGNIGPPLKVEECFREGVSQPAVDDYSGTVKCG